MTWSTMADVPNPIIVDAAGTAGSGYVLKAYLPGTTTSTSIAIDSSGSSPQTSITANADGIWEVSGNEIVPHIDRKHKWGIFANATDATANTPFYMGPFDNIEQAATTGSASSVFTPTGTGGVETTVEARLQKQFRAEEYDTFANAVTAAAGAELVISTNIVVSSNTTVSGMTLRFLEGGNLDPDTGVVITLETTPEAGWYEIFDSSAAGTIVFGADHRYAKADWWGLDETGVVGAETSIVKGMTALSGKGRLDIGPGNYTLKGLLTTPTFYTSDSPVEDYTPLVVKGQGMFATTFTMRTANDGIAIEGGYSEWYDFAVYGHDTDSPGQNAFVVGSDSTLSAAARTRISRVLSRPSGGKSFLLKDVHTVWITECIGQQQNNAGYPSHVEASSLTSISSFVEGDIDGASEYANSIIIHDNLSEGAATTLINFDGGTTTNSFILSIKNNQFENATSSIVIDRVNHVVMEGNYLHEGGNGSSPPVTFQNVSFLRVGPNYFPAVNGASGGEDREDIWYFNNVTNGVIDASEIPGVYLAGTTRLVFNACVIGKIFDESARESSFINCDSAAINPSVGINIDRGQPFVPFANVSSLPASYYPYARQGTKLRYSNNVTTSAGEGTITTEGSAGAIVQTVGTGPDPSVIAENATGNGDYLHATAYDVKVIVSTGGTTGTATFIAKFDTAGNSFATETACQVDNPTLNGSVSTTSEWGNVLKDNSGRPLIQIKWPTGQTYVSNDEWTWTATVAPVITNS